MADFVVYHNPDTARREYHHEWGSLFCVHTNKSTICNCRGDTIWIVQGKAGKPRKKFTLEARFVLDATQPSDHPNFAWEGLGREGVTFDPPIPLNGLPWFDDFFDKQHNFRSGFNEIDPATVRHLEKLEAEREQEEKEFGRPIQT